MAVQKSEALLAASSVVVGGGGGLEGDRSRSVNRPKHLLRNSMWFHDKSKWPPANPDRQTRKDRRTDRQTREARYRASNTWTVIHTRAIHQQDHNRVSVRHPRSPVQWCAHFMVRSIHVRLQGLHVGSVAGQQQAKGW